MSSLYNDFEKRYTDSWFSAGWVEVEAKSKPTQMEIYHKDLTTLEAELNNINERIENISQKQLRLNNLAKLYN